nr:thymidine phosphorylase [Mycolicibacter nonchromogenicus]
MKELDDARELARRMVGLGTAHGVATRALITDMSTPLGCTVGNAVEVAEALEVLGGGGPIVMFTASGVSRPGWAGSCPPTDGAPMRCRCSWP